MVSSFVARAATTASVLFMACAPSPQTDLVHIPSLASATSPPPPPVVAPLVGRGDPVDVAPVRERHGKGEKLQVEWHGQVYPATVLGTTKDGKTRIHYDGYGDEWDEDVDEDRIRDAADDTADP